MTDDQHPHDQAGVPDPVVARALRTLPVPEATPAFWASLQDRLEATAQEPSAIPPVAPAGIAEPAEEPAEELAAVVPIGTARTMRWRVPAVVAAAAAVVVAVAFVAGGQPEQGLVAVAPSTSVPVVPSTEATVAPTTTQPERSTTTARATTSTSASTQRTEPRSGQQAVQAFTAAVDKGDAGAAWSLLANRSRAYWNTQERFAASMTELAEGGYGSWSTTPGRTASSVVVASSGDGEILIVTLRGKAPAGSAAPARVQAFPIRHVKGTFRLEIFDVGPGGTVPEVTGPGQVADATVRTSNPRPSIEVRTVGDSVLWSIDARDTLLAPASGGKATFTPEQPLTKGTHVLTVASMGPDWLTATAAVIEVS